VEILEVVREEIVETPEEVRDPQVADKEDEVDLRVEGKDLVEIPEEVKEEIVETLELEEEAAVVRDWKQELGKS